MPLLFQNEEIIDLRTDAHIDDAEIRHEKIFRMIVNVRGIPDNGSGGVVEIVNSHGAGNRRIQSGRGKLPLHRHNENAVFQHPPQPVADCAVLAP